MSYTLKFQDPSVIMLIGAPGCGKSSWATNHFTDHEILRSDYYRYLVSGDENDQGASKGAFKILDLILDERLKHDDGHTCVIDATNINPKQRINIVQAAKKYNKPVYAVVFGVDEAQNLTWNRKRARVVPEDVIRNFRERLTEVTDEVLAQEGVSTVYRIDPTDNNKIQRMSVGPNAHYDDPGPFDIIGDVHGCAGELAELLFNLGYCYQDAMSFVHPYGRKAVFVGDLVDRGPNSSMVLETVFLMTGFGNAYIVASNHDDKFKRYLKGNKVKVGNGLQMTIDQIKDWTPEQRQVYFEWLDAVPSHLVLDNGKLVVSHAGLEERYHGRDEKKVKDLAMYGITTGQVGEDGFIIREDLAARYTGQAIQVHGHIVVDDPGPRSNIWDVDQGCVFGGKLTALRYPEMEIIQVAAKQIYYE
jgi:protein phosphatase